MTFELKPSCIIFHFVMEHWCVFWRQHIGVQCCCFRSGKKLNSDVATEVDSDSDWISTKTFFYLLRSQFFHVSLVSVLENEEIKVHQNACPAETDHTVDNDLGHALEGQKRTRYLSGKPRIQFSIWQIIILGQPRNKNDIFGRTSTKVCSTRGEFPLKSDDFDMVFQ